MKKTTILIIITLFIVALIAQQSFAKVVDHTNCGAVKGVLDRFITWMQLKHCTGRNPSSTTVPAGICNGLADAHDALKARATSCSTTGGGSTSGGGLLAGCFDDDDDKSMGDSLFVKGTTTALGMPNIDYCTFIEDPNRVKTTFAQDNMLVEYYCENNRVKEHHVVGACAEGRLIDYTDGKVPSGSTCYDTDNLRATDLIASRRTQGTVRTISGQWYTDTCFTENGKLLKWDYYCNGKVIAVEKICSCDRNTGTALAPEKC